MAVPERSATLTYAVVARVTLGDPAHLLDLSFTGPPGEYQPLKSALDHILRQHDAVLKATVTARFDPALDLSGQGVEDILGRARDTGPAKCTVTITTEAD